MPIDPQPCAQLVTIRRAPASTIAPIEPMPPQGRMPHLGVMPPVQDGWIAPGCHDWHENS